MSKKALGSIPSFNNVTKATKELELDIDFNATEKKNPLLIEEETEAEAKRKFKENRRAEIKKQQKAELERLVKHDEEDIKKEVIQENPKSESKEDEKPTTKKHLKEGFTRATFAVRDDHLELIKALASYRNLEQKELLEAILDNFLGDIKDQVKKEALEIYRRKGDKEKQNIKDIFN